MDGMEERVYNIPNDTGGMTGSAVRQGAVICVFLS